MLVRVVETTAVTSGPQGDLIHPDLSECHAAMVWMTNVTADGTPASGSAISHGFIADQNQSTDVGQACNYYYATDTVGTSACAAGSDNDAVIALPSSTTGFDGVATGDFVPDGGSGAGISLSWSNYPAGTYRIKAILFGGSDVEAYVDSVVVAAGANDITAPSFEPRVVFFGAAEGSATTDLEGNFGTAGGAINYGCAWNGPSSTVTQQCATLLQVNNAGTSRHIGGTFEENAAAADISLHFVTIFGGEWRTMQTSDFDLNGFTLTAPAASPMAVNYMALDWASAQGFWLGSSQAPTSDGTQAETGPGFTPQFVGSVFTNSPTLNDIQDSNGGELGADSIWLGGYDGTAHVGVGVAGEGGQAGTHDNQAHSSTTNIVEIYESGDALNASATVSSFDASTGFTYTWANTTSPGAFGYSWAVEAGSADNFDDTYNENVNATQGIAKGYDLHY